MNEFEQTLLFATTAIILVGTLIVFVWQYFRSNRKTTEVSGRGVSSRFAVPERAKRDEGRYVRWS